METPHYSPSEPNPSLHPGTMRGSEMNIPFAELTAGVIDSLRVGETDLVSVDARQELQDGKVRVVCIDTGGLTHAFEYDPVDPVNPVIHYFVGEPGKR